MTTTETVDLPSMIAADVCGLQQILEWSDGRSNDQQWASLHGSIQEIVQHALRNAQSEAVAVKVLEMAAQIKAMATETWRWSGSAFVAGEKVDDPEGHMGDLYSWLCGLGNSLEHWSAEIALTHPAPPPAVTDERITEAVDLIGEASGYTGDPDALRLINKALAALTAALEAKQ